MTKRIIDSSLLRRSTFRSIAALGGALFLNCATAQEQSPSLMGVDVYGTGAFDGSSIRSEFAEELTTFLQKTSARDLPGSEEIEARMRAALAQRGDFALVEVSAVDYFRQPTITYVTIDVVERKDAERRMPFRERPSGRYEDPEGLIASWNEYQTKFFQLMSPGSVKSGECEVLHCLAAFRPNPDLLPYLAVFDSGVARNEDVLYDIAMNDADDLHRGNAVYLLAHSHNIDRLLSMLGRAMYDQSPLIRNNAMRIMGQMAERDPDLAYPVEDLIRAMDFAMATDRNKAALTVARLAESSRHRARIQQLAVPTALRLLRLEQPINHDPAYELLKTVSGQDFEPRDYEAWDRWFARNSVD